MFQRLISYMTLSMTRFSLRNILKLKDTRDYYSVNEIMQTYQENLIKHNQLNEDLTAGPVLARNKLSKKLIASFTLMRHKQHEDDFYLQVAKEWVNKRSKQ
ncbi:hypothetical protein [Aquibacillus saliphilus]|uniref:hypothetical protein n=1 Tax=Aquibacillus saliphilus TaxID=1909422 RepID=UPI001CF08206|nr:hypothetical protein [Aquibacillus saliphilus]